MDNITDIWFRTSLKLITLAQNLDIQEIQPDIENYWEWITGYYENYHIDITRCHLTKAIETDSCIFSLDRRSFSEKFINSMTKNLKNLNITPIYLGRWEYISGDDNFNKIELYKII